MIKISHQPVHSRITYNVFTKFADRPMQVSTQSNERQKEVYIQRKNTIILFSVHT